MTLLASWFVGVLIAAAWAVVAITIALPIGAMIKRRDRQVPTEYQPDQSDQPVERRRAICAEAERLSRINNPTDADEAYLNELRSEFAGLDERPD